jgi:hypothetical protein
MRTGPAIPEREKVVIDSCFSAKSTTRFDHWLESLPMSFNNDAICRLIIRLRELGRPFAR